MKKKQKEERVIVKVIREICAERNIQYTSFSYDWIFRLSKNERINFIMGYNFGINAATSSQICDDKCATSDVLLNAGVSTVEHNFYMSPTNIKYVGKEGNWSKLTSFLKKHKKIVCKANEGTGGNDVYLVENQFQLEEAIHRIFRNSRAMAVSPYYDIQKEYRAIILDGDVKLVYSKNIPCIIGDGQSTIHALLLKYMTENSCFIDNITFDDTLLSVLPNNVEYRMNWKHNLGKGAKPIILSQSKDRDRLVELAKRAAQALAIQFASVDIIETCDNTYVLEVNSGIMMESFMQTNDENYVIAKEIYKQAIDIMLEI